MEKKRVIVLGGGLAGLSTGFYLQESEWIDSVTILEKENVPGGLCRSVRTGDYVYDVGPHIIFSKDKEILNEILSFLDKNYTSIKRSNEIFYKDRLIQYPFENDLSKLPDEELKYCIDTFNNNPYEDYKATNMLQFFLKTFGEGITNTYLRPYNEKIWKFDLSFMNTDMVERIPKPTREEIQKSASGATIDGYLHQLFFNYPGTGGISSVIAGICDGISRDGFHIKTSECVSRIEKQKEHYLISTDLGSEYEADTIISTIPIQEFGKACVGLPDDIVQSINELKYNSIMIAFIKVPYDNYGEHFTYTIPSKDIVFHRISKMDYLGENYHKEGEATYIVEITYKPGQRELLGTDEQIMNRIREGMVKIKAAKSEGDAEIIDVTHYEYAYVVYDLKHNVNMNRIRSYLEGTGIFLNGRFGNFEYWNMDKVLLETKKLINKMNDENHD